MLVILAISEFDNIVGQFYVALRLTNNEKGRTLMKELADSEKHEGKIKVNYKAFSLAYYWILIGFFILILDCVLALLFQGILWKFDFWELFWRVTGIQFWNEEIFPNFLYFWMETDERFKLSLVPFSLQTCGEIWILLAPLSLPALEFLLGDSDSEETENRDVNEEDIQLGAANKNLPKKDQVSTFNFYLTLITIT